MILKSVHKHKIIAFAPKAALLSGSDGSRSGTDCALWAEPQVGALCQGRADIPIRDSQSP